MINLKINNFKCFRNAEIPLNNLTIFAGANGNGKSTAIQALLLLRRTIEHCATWNYKTKLFDFKKPNGLNVELNGPYCLNLGNSSYVLSVDSEAEIISFAIENDNNKFQVTYGINKGNELWLTPIKPLINEFDSNPLYFQEFYYLNAERIGSRLSQNIKFHDYHNVGYKGEYTAQIISNLNYNFNVDEDRVNKENLKGNRFEHHVNAWLSFILPGVSIIPDYNDKTHTARIEVENNFSKGNPVVPTNTGFGISYVLPIIVSGLIAKKDRFFIVENPEAHLHPSAQSRIGYFLGVMANAGVRIIVETHSDHIINGIQLAVAKNVIPNDCVTINYFNSGSEKSQPEIISISITEKGELTKWPLGFFDQSQIDLVELFKIRSSNE